jgi:type IV pilus assembly protein PilC
MPLFEYQVRTAAGELSKGTLEAATSGEAAQILRRQGAYISQLNEAQEQEDILTRLKNFSVDFGPSRKDVLNFSNQLAVMIKAGISIHDALEGIGEQMDNPKFKKIIIAIKNDVEGGQSLSGALGKYPDVFSNLYVNMMAAAEISGSLASMLEQLAHYLDQEAETRSQVRGAMVYPCIIALMAVSVTVFLLTFVLPRFTAIFAGKEQLLPTPTKIIMATSAFLRGYWYFIVPAIGVAIWGFLYFIGTQVGRYWWDKTKLVAPIIKKLCRSLYITRSLHTMGVLTGAGVPILDTLSITSEISGNTLYRKMWVDVHDSVRQGQKIASSLAASPLLPSSVVQMIRSGEDSGKLAEVLRDISEFYGRELKATIKTVTAMIEPIMIILMGVLVGFIAMSIILPIFKMSSLVLGKH